MSMSTTVRSLAEKTLAAEVRAVETGHQAVLRHDGSVSVVSDSTPGLHWIVRAFTAREGDGIWFECRADNAALAYGRGHFPITSAVPGALPCLHCARAARRLEREGLARFEGGVWVATAKAAASVQTAPVDVDPFRGLPS